MELVNHFNTFTTYVVNESTKLCNLLYRPALVKGVLLSEFVSDRFNLKSQYASQIIQKICREYGPQLILLIKEEYTTSQIHKELSLSEEDEKERIKETQALLFPKVLTSTMKHGICVPVFILALFLNNCPRSKTVESVISTMRFLPPTTLELRWKNIMYTETRRVFCATDPGLATSLWNYQQHSSGGEEEDEGEEKQRPDHEDDETMLGRLIGNFESLKYSGDVLKAFPGSNKKPIIFWVPYPQEKTIQCAVSKGVKQENLNIVIHCTKMEIRVRNIIYRYRKMIPQLLMYYCEDMVNSGSPAKDTQTITKKRPASPTSSEEEQQEISTKRSKSSCSARKKLSFTPPPVTEIAVGGATEGKS